jgi:rod shape-determining protein MreC
LSKKSERRKSHPFLYLGLFVICWWILPASIKIFTQTAFREFQAPIWDLASRLDDLTNYWGHLSDSKKTLISKGKDLSRLEADIKFKQFREGELMSEIKRLQSIEKTISELNKTIKLDPSKRFISVNARVTIRKMNGWWQQMTIRKGLNDSISIGDGVLFNEGALGRIIHVDSRSSEIELITNPNFRIVAHFEKDNRPVTYQGNGINVGGQAHGLVMDVPHDIQTSKKNPLKLVTSSLGGNFPKGIPIGVVYELEGDNNGLFKMGKVIINKKITEVLEVAVLRELEN